MWVVRLCEGRNAPIRNKKGSADIDVFHQFPSLPFGLISGCKWNGARIVNQDVNLTKCIYSCLDDLANAFFKPYISLQWKHLARASLFDLLGSGKYRPIQFGIRLSGFAHDDDVCPFAG